MPRKQDKPWRRERRDRERVAARIRNRFPQVREITLDLTFTDHDQQVAPSQATPRYSGDDPAFFEIDCPMRECVSGGFDLTEAVTAMLSNRQAVASGTVVCQGWQDEERDGQNRCRCTMAYTVRATYAS